MKLICNLIISLLIPLRIDKHVVILMMSQNCSINHRKNIQKRMNNYVKANWISDILKKSRTKQKYILTQYRILYKDEPKWVLKTSLFIS